MCGAEFVNHFGIAGIHAPYKDFGSMFADVARGDLTFVCASIASSQNYYKAGTVNYIAVTADARNQNYRDIPSLRELLPNNNFYIKEGWVAFFASRGESAEVVQRIKDDVVQVMNEPAMLETLNVMNYSAIPTSQLDRRAAAYSNEIPQWKKIIDRMKVKLD
jgi:tripartite-type tricarboxylate transporter receptor subunit TctC